MAKLSARRQQILDYIRVYRAQYGFAPSVRDIQQACKISSTSVVDYNLRILQRDGLIRRFPDISRAIEVVGDSPRSAAEPVTVPLVGVIAAGAPIPVLPAEAQDGRQTERVSLPPELTPRSTDGLYALRVRGHSMIDALIDDGDIVVIRRAANPSDGDMVVAWLRLEEEATLKRFYRHGDQIRLQPANVNMEPLLVPAGNVEVHGKVVAILRRLE